MKGTVVNAEALEIGTNLTPLVGEVESLRKKKKSIDMVVEEKPLICPMKAQSNPVYSVDALTGRVVSLDPPFCDKEGCAWWRGSYCSSSYGG